MATLQMFAWFPVTLTEGRRRYQSGEELRFKISKNLYNFSRNYHCDVLFAEGRRYASQDPNEEPRYTCDFYTNDPEFINRVVSFLEGGEDIEIASMISFEAPNGDSLDLEY